MRRHTKIIATLGPSVATEDAILAMVEAGMDVARLNFSHGGHDLHRSFAKWVRSAAAESGRSVALLQDIQGPKLRVGEFPGGRISLARGAEVKLVPEDGQGGPDVIPCGYAGLLEDVSEGHEVVLADGMIRLLVQGRGDDHLKALVLTGGELGDHKGVAFPDSELSLANVTAKDELDLEFGRELEVDFVAASFVRSGADIESVAALAGEAPVIAKVELAQAYNNLDDILDKAFGVMVARGDLGVQLPLERLPLIQTDMLNRTNAAGAISITATEMLESMTHSPRPTRAEVTDVSYAVQTGTDAVMLSGETAVGDYPIESIRAMAAICTTVEEGTLSSREDDSVPFVGDRNRVASAVAHAAKQVAINVGAKRIVAFTESGNTARLISKYRPEAEVVAFSPNPVTRNRMALFWGIEPHDFERETYTDHEIASAAAILKKEGLVHQGDTIVMVAGVPPNVKASTNLLKVHVVGELSGGLGS